MLGMILLAIVSIALTIAMFTLPVELQAVCLTLLVGLPMCYMVVDDIVSDIKENRLK